MILFKCCLTNAFVRYFEKKKKPLRTHFKAPDVVWYIYVLYFVITNIQVQHNDII